MAQNITINIGSVTNNGAPCHDPQILIFGADGVAFPCGKQVDKNGGIKIFFHFVFIRQSCSLLFTSIIFLIF